MSQETRDVLLLVDATIAGVSYASGSIAPATPRQYEYLRSIGACAEVPVQNTQVEEKSREGAKPSRFRKKNSRGEK